MKKYQLDKYREQIENLYMNEKLSCKKISEMLGCSLSGVYDALKRWDIKTRDLSKSHAIYSCDESFFDEIDNEFKAYWLGFIYADGYITQNNLGITLSYKDKSHINKFSQHIKSTHPINTYESKTQYGICKYSRLLIKSDRIVNALKSKGVYENKSLILKFPWMYVEEGFMKDFIRGYFDGDGSLILSHNSINFKICGTNNLLNGIIDVLNRELDIEFKHKLYKRKQDDKDNYYISYGGRLKTLAVMKYLYEESKIHLDRKYEKYILLKDSIKNI